MALKTWDGSTDGDWQTAANWTAAAVPIAGDEVVFDATSVVSVTEGMLPSETGGIDYDLIHIKKGYSGSIGSEGEPLAIGKGVQSTFVVFIQGSGTYHIMCTDGTDAGSTADANLQLVIVDNPDATVYLYSQDNDAAISSVFKKVMLLAGTLYLQTEAATGSAGNGTAPIVTTLVIAPRKQMKANATCYYDIDGHNEKNATNLGTDLIMFGGTLTSDSKFNDVYLHGGTLSLGTDGGGGTEVDIAGTLYMYNGTFNWNPDEASAHINRGYIYGGTINCSKTINTTRTRLLGGGSGNGDFVYVFEGSTCNFDTGTAVVDINAGNVFMVCGGKVVWDDWQYENPTYNYGLYVSEP